MEATPHANDGFSRARIAHRIMQGSAAFFAATAYATTFPGETIALGAMSGEWAMGAVRVGLAALLIVAISARTPRHRADQCARWAAGASFALGALVLLDPSLLGLVRSGVPLTEGPVLLAIGALLVAARR